MLVHIAIDPLTSESTVLSIKKDRKISYIDFNTKSFEFRTLTASYAAITGGEKRTEYGANYCYGCMRELPEGQVTCPSCGHDNSVSVNQNMVLKEATTLQNCREKISPTGKEVVNNIVVVRPAFWL